LSPKTLIYAHEPLENQGFRPVNGYHPAKGSMRTKRYQATLDVAFLEEILKQES
jgi:hypothetical protein